jgi:membrane-bound inhibitor of C-type lysozyme
MKTGMIVAAAAMALVLAGCNEEIGGPGASTYYDCGDGVRLKVDSVDIRSVTVQMNNDPPVTLPAVKAASGAKYMSATHEFWSKGEEATWTVGRMAPMTCKQVKVPRGM